VHLDDRALAERIEESRDLHADSMHETKAALDELVEVGQESRDTRDPEEDARVARDTGRRLTAGATSGGVLAAAGLGAALAAFVSSPAFADQTTDVQMLQTAASLENLAVATYDVALTLDFIGGGSANAVVKAFVTVDGEPESSTWAVKSNVPAWVGVPVIWPAAPSDRPSGREPLATLHEYVPAPPMAAIVALYGVPSSPSGSNEPVTIVNETGGVGFGFVSASTVFTA